MPAIRKMTIEKVKLIPHLLEQGKTLKEIGIELGASERCIQFWIKRLKYAGVKLHITRGPKPMKLN